MEAENIDETLLSSIAVFFQQIQSTSTYLTMGMYLLRIAIPFLSLWKPLYYPMKKKCFWMPILVTFIVTLDLVFTGKIYFCSTQSVKAFLNQRHT